MGEPEIKPKIVVEKMTNDVNVSSFCQGNAMASLLNR